MALQFKWFVAAPETSQNASPTRDHMASEFTHAATGAVAIVELQDDIHRNIKERSIPYYPTTGYQPWYHHLHSYSTGLAPTSNTGSGHLRRKRIIAISIGVVLAIVMIGCFAYLGFRFWPTAETTTGPIAETTTIVGTTTIAADCNEFLPHGVAAGDVVHLVTDASWSNTYATNPFRGFGAVKDGLVLARNSWASYAVQPLDGTVKVYINPREMSPIVYPPAARVGSEYVRHVTDGQDLQRVNQVLGSTYDGVIIITGIDIAGQEQPLKYSYQVWYAYRSDKNMVAMLYGEPQDTTSERYIYESGTKYPLVEADILDGGITAIDITAAAGVADGESLPVSPTC